MPDAYLPGLLDLAFGADPCSLQFWARRRSPGRRIQERFRSWHRAQRCRARLRRRRRRPARVHWDVRLSRPSLWRALMKMIDTLPRVLDDDLRSTGLQITVYSGSPSDTAPRRTGQPNALTTGRQSSGQARSQRTAPPVCRKAHPCIRRYELPHDARQRRAEPRLSSKRRVDLPGSA
jgi:hypothetical protein